MTNSYRSSTNNSPCQLDYLQYHVSEINYMKRSFGEQAGKAKRRIVKGMRDQPYRRPEPVPRLRTPAGEMKYFDCDRAASALAATTTTWVAGTILDPLTTIDLGDAAVATPLSLFSPIISGNLNGRIGRKVKVFKIKIHGNINIPDGSQIASAPSATQFRLMLVLDKQTNIAQMTSAQLMNNGSGAISTLKSFQNPNNFGRFQVLKEKNYVIGNLSTTGVAVGSTIEASGDSRNFNLTYTFKEGLPVNFNATVGGTVTSIIDNSFHLIVACDNIVLAPTIAYYSRVCYKE